MMFMASISYYSMVIHHSRGPSFEDDLVNKHICLGNKVNVPFEF